MFLSTSSFWLGRSFKNLSKSSFDLRNWSVVVDAHQEDVAHVVVGPRNIMQLAVLNARREGKVRIRKQKVRGLVLSVGLFCRLCVKRNRGVTYSCSFRKEGTSKAARHIHAKKTRGQMEP